MTQQHEKLSAFLDGEHQDSEIALSLTQDSELAEKWKGLFCRGLRMWYNDLESRGDSESQRDCKYGDCRSQSSGTGTSRAAHC